MKNNSSPSSVTFLSIMCSTFGHDYITTRKITNHINEYKCTNCGREVTDNYSGKLEALTTNLKQVNSIVLEFFQKRNRRISA